MNDEFFELMNCSKTNREKRNQQKNFLSNSLVNIYLYCLLTKYNLK